MNREQRRKQKKNKKQDTIMIDSKMTIDDLKAQVTNGVLDLAFVLMLSIPTMVIHDKYSKITKLNVSGKSREERFVDMCLETYDAFLRGYVELEDLINTLKEETGLELSIELLNSIRSVVK